MLDITEMVSVVNIMFLHIFVRFFVLIFCEWSRKIIFRSVFFLVILVIVWNCCLMLLTFYLRWDIFLRWNDKKTKMNIDIFLHVLIIKVTKLLKAVRDMWAVDEDQMLQNNQTINDKLYVEQMIKEAIELKRHNRWYGVTIQADNARPNVANMTRYVIKDLGWEVLPHPSI